jgi:hypothetical protein
MALFNNTGFIYTVTEAISSNITGDLFLTLLLYVLLIMLLAFAFRIPLEFTVILVFPLLIAFGVEAGAGFAPVLGVGIVYLAVLFAKNFFFFK